MSPEDFRALLARSGGLIGTEIVDKAEPETVNGVATGRFKPRSGPIRLRYTTPNGEITAVQGDDGRFEILDDPKGLVKGGGAAGARPRTRTFPDGSLRVEDPDAPDGWRVVATKPQGPQLNEAPTLHTLPNGDQASWNPATSQWDIQFKKPQGAPALTVGAPGPGQKTDLRTMKLQYDLFVQQLDADPNLTPAQRTQRIQAYIATNVTPAIQRATDEVNAEADRVRKRQEEQDARAAGREDRATTTAERAAALSQAEFQYRAGQDTVSNAMKLLEYQHNPLFLEQFSAGLNTLSRGGGPVTFTPEAFRIPLPDTNALAEQGAQRAAALYAQAGGAPFTPRPVAGAPMQPTPLGGPPGPVAAAGSAGTLLANSAMAAPPPRVPGLVATPGGRDQWGLPVPPPDPFAPGDPTNY